MDKAAFQELVEAIQSGDNQPLGKVYRTYATTCIQRLQRSLGITMAEAEDLFMDAMWKFRLQVLANKLKYQNLGGYLFIIAKNLWLDQQRKKKKIGPLIPTIETDVIDRFFSKGLDVYQSENFNDYLKKEYQKDSELQQAQKIHQILTAFNLIGVRCRQLLQAFIVENKSLTEIQELLGYSSYNSVKSSKNQCKKQLIKKIKELNK